LPRRAHRRPPVMGKIQLCGATSGSLSRGSQLYQPQPLKAFPNYAPCLPVSRLVWHTRYLTTLPAMNPYKRHRLPAEINSLCVCLAFHFCLSYRDDDEPRPGLLIHSRHRLRYCWSVHEDKNLHPTLSDEEARALLLAPGRILRYLHQARRAIALQ
jgi:hypothetical protein